MKDIALLILRVAFGGLMAGHGSQKLFGWFGGPGMKGTEGMMGSMGLHPRKLWGAMAGASEFGGGMLTMLGALNPLGSIATMGSMGMATAKVHWGKPIWVTSGGAELPVLNMAAVLALGLTGPGKFSVDNALGMHLPRRLMLVPGLALAAGAVAAGVISSNKAQPHPQPQTEKQAQPQARAEERPQAVHVPGTPEAGEPARSKEDGAMLEPARMVSTELHAGENAAQP